MPRCMSAQSTRPITAEAEVRCIMPGVSPGPRNEERCSSHPRVSTHCGRVMAAPEGSLTDRYTQVENIGGTFISVLTSLSQTQLALCSHFAHTSISLTHFHTPPRLAVPYIDSLELCPDTGFQIISSDVCSRRPSRSCCTCTHSHSGPSHQCSRPAIYAQSPEQSG